MKNEIRTGVIILAAGSSSRLGQPKQLLEFNGKTLLEIAVEAAQNSLAQSCVVVLGANAELISSSIKNIHVDKVVNENWKNGMASSMQKGLKYLMENSDPDQVILMLSDQPFVNKEILNLLITNKLNTNSEIIACRYKETFGVPVLFSKKYFPELLSLTGNEGAKKLVMAHQDDLHAIDFPKGAIDIDTMEDYLKLKNDS
ncbi:nucleotidyltransferase family protein [Aquiflexum gelatinilyticum]|uniref:Nucleotidyltransferase family protein n=1 Tax=Aquiflexum gelatinilyticum TaxID=2961943 RepID=A0A9X2P8F9_9BACT|nr:nucleotidyltransferase family protein [Aquiflexum gelatinilyticum]MCR9015675.1 nucleotidyltransferase family protein [Aquiflexum gelatinilyticum]